MSVSISWTADGLWSWLIENEGDIPRAKIVRAVRRAQKQAFLDWCKLPLIGLSLRFSPRGFADLGLTPRSRGYQRRQIKKLGQVLPYVSPNGSQDGASGTMRNAVMSGGYRVSSINGTGNAVTTQLSVTGARQLNRISDEHHGATYRREFLGFDAGGKKDAEWILARTNELAMQYLRKDMERARKKVLVRQRYAQNNASYGAA